ncbi:hypothetical protein [Bacillus horti]|uniref:Uncharacterized protein n=1 Tax=Caldalkalibacillus horti TaxID=77523 RepID=A0ABT9VWJ1_9BACI|nr:hypothetical protein [Bacillus horti]MDQ0165244.1 hypothetical protein [Bacillus horti]
MSKSISKNILAFIKGKISEEELKDRIRNQSKDEPTLKRDFKQKSN